MAGPMPGSTPIAVPSRTPSEGVQQVGRRQRGGEALDQRGQCVHQRIPFRMPTGRLMPRPRANRYQEPTDRTTAMNDVTDVVPAAEREGRPPEEDRAGEGPAERLDEQRVRDERGREHADGAPVGAAAELDVLAALGLATAAAAHVDGEEDADDDQQAADDDRDAAGRRPGRGRSGSPAEQRRDDARGGRWPPGTGPLRARSGPAPGCRRRRQRSCQAQLAHDALDALALVV